MVRSKTDSTVRMVRSTTDSTVQMVRSKTDSTVRMVRSTTDSTVRMVRSTTDSTVLHGIGGINWNVSVFDLATLSTVTDRQTDRQTH
jgi:hypothetical protein